jgi:hypothetical protein
MTDAERAIVSGGGSVALIGPHGGGKSLYRAFRYRRYRQLPLFLQHALGVQSSGLGRSTPERWDPRWGWREGPETASERHEEYADYLRRRASTPAIYRHALSFPSLGRVGGVARGHERGLRFMLDFPGECLRRRELPLDTTGVLELVSACRVILFMIPFWILLPRAHRQMPTDLEVEMARALDPSASYADIETRRLLRDRALYESAAAWLDLAEEMLGRARAKQTVIVALSMLGDDFIEEVRKESRDGVPVVRELRALWRLIRTPAANGAAVWDADGWRGAELHHQLGRSLAKRLLPPWNAGAVRHLLYRVDAAARAFLDESRREGERTVGVYDPAPPLADKLLGLAALSHRTRYLGINVVSERRMLLRGDTEYLLEEPRGTILPELYFAAHLDELPKASRVAGVDAPARSAERARGERLSRDDRG